MKGKKPNLKNDKNSIRNRNEMEKKIMKEDFLKSLEIDEKLFEQKLKKFNLGIEKNKQLENSAPFKYDNLNTSKSRTSKDRGRLNQSMNKPIKNYLYKPKHNSRNYDNVCERYKSSFQTPSNKRTMNYMNMLGKTSAKPNNRDKKYTSMTSKKNDKKNFSIFKNVFNKYNDNKNNRIHTNPNTLNKKSGNKREIEQNTMPKKKITIKDDMDNRSMPKTCRNNNSKIEYNRSRSLSKNKTDHNNTMRSRSRNLSRTNIDRNNTMGNRSRNMSRSRIGNNNSTGRNFSRSKSKIEPKNYMRNRSRNMSRSRIGNNNSVGNRGRNMSRSKSKVDNNSFMGNTARNMQRLRIGNNNSVGNRGRNMHRSRSRVDKKNNKLNDGNLSRTNRRNNNIGNTNMNMSRTRINNNKIGNRNGNMSRTKNNNNNSIGNRSRNMSRSKSRVEKKGFTPSRSKSLSKNKTEYNIGDRNRNILRPKIDNLKTVGNRSRNMSRTKLRNYSGEKKNRSFSKTKNENKDNLGNSYRNISNLNTDNNKDNLGNRSMSKKSLENKDNSGNKGILKIKPENKDYLQTSSNSSRKNEMKKNPKKRLLIDRSINLYIIPKNVKFNKEKEEMDYQLITKIKELEGDVQDKNDMILDLKDKLKKKNENMMVTPKEYNQMKSNIDDLTNQLDKKNKVIDDLKDEIKNLQSIIKDMKQQNENSKLKEEKNKEEIQNLHSELSRVKDEASQNEKKLNNLKKLTKASNKDYNDLNKDFQKIKDEKERMESIVDQQNEKISFYQNHIKNLKRLFCEDVEKKRKWANSIVDAGNETDPDIVQKNIERKKRSRDNKYKRNITGSRYLENQNSYDPEEKMYYKNRNDRIRTDFDLDNRNNMTTIYNNNNNDDSDNEDIKTVYKFRGNYDKNSSVGIRNNRRDYERRRNPSGYGLGRELDSFIDDEKKYKTDAEDDFDSNLEYNLQLIRRRKLRNKKDEYLGLNCFPCEQHLEDNQEEINYLDHQIVILNREKTKLENELLKLPEHPKSLVDIKSKRLIISMIEQNDKHISMVKSKLRKIKEPYLRKDLYGNSKKKI